MAVVGVGDLRQDSIASRLGGSVGCRTVCALIAEGEPVKLLSQSLGGDPGGMGLSVIGDAAFRRLEENRRRADHKGDRTVSKEIVAASLARKPGSDAGITAGVGLFGSLGQDGDLALIRRDNAHQSGNFRGLGKPVEDGVQPLPGGGDPPLRHSERPALYGDSLIVSGGGEGHSCLIASGFRGKVG